MCGIAGFVGLDDKKLLKQMCDVIEYRGPDDWGLYLDRGIGLGARRLSIIDLEGGHQPVHNEDKTIWIVFNGEVYNFLDLKALIEKNGHRFYTNCDTEAIVHLYEIFGEKCVNYLRGMFAFAIWDSKKRSLFLARDRLGKKPLYYTNLDGNVLFGSEIKSILQCTEVKREVDLQALDEFLTLQYVPGSRTMFKNIWKLQPGHTLTVETGKISVKRYWDLEISEKYTNEGFCKQKILGLMKESVKIRMMSEVPLGVYLSGGVDSSAITALMCMDSTTHINTFTVGFGHHGDEFGYARMVADKYGTNHREIIVDQKNFNALPKIVWHFDEPVADPAALPTYLMSQKTKKYATVALVGEGGDEVFAGYEKYGIMLRLYKNKLARTIFNKVTLSAAAFGIGLAKKNKKTEFLSEFSKIVDDRSEAFSRLSALGFTSDEKKEIYSDNIKTNKFEEIPIKKYFSNESSVFHDMLLYDMKVWLPDRLLMKVDKMTMASSVEARAPFMDHMLVEFSNNISPELRLNKYILKKSLVGILPKQILDRKKHGFAVPIGEWFKEGLSGIAQNILEEKSIRGYFKRGVIDKILQNTQKLRNDHKLWNLINFALWHKIYIDGWDPRHASLKL